MVVTVLGCGPAGLMAAHACAQEGVEFFIYSIKRPSVLSGAQYLHMPLPGLHSLASPDGRIVYVKTGSRDGYARKVYGHTDVPVSWDTFDEGLHDAWSLKMTYEKLWEMYVDRIQHVQLTGKMVAEMLTHNDLVISAIPAPAICVNGAHQFHQTSVWIRDGHPGADPALDMNTIVYNGDPQVRWYRASNLFGHSSVEYGHHASGTVRGMKPLRNDCTCHQDGNHPTRAGHFIRVGRFGRWTRGVLSHDGFVRTQHALHQL